METNMLITEEQQLYSDYLDATKGVTNEERMEIILRIMTKYPKIIDYIENRVHTCFGEHRVYFVILRVDGETFLKVGYTKNSVYERFADKRYTKGHKVEVVEIIREELFQAKGAVDFEKKLKELIPAEYRYKTELTFPGKDELISMDYKDEVLNLYNDTFMGYKDVVGLKSAN
jgi:hypothetical protein